MQLGLKPKRLAGDAGVKRRARWLSSHPLCVHCLERGRYTAAEEVDHVVALGNGGEDDEGNLQSLCRPCHVQKTAADTGYRPRGCDASGLPTDPRHPWNN